MRPRRPSIPACLAAAAAAVCVTGLWIRSRPAEPAVLPVIAAARARGFAPAGATPVPPGPRAEVPAASLDAVAELRPASSPSAADEEALLRLVEEARGEADPSLRRERLAAICLRWADFDPSAAVALASDLDLDPLGGALLPNLAQQWAARDFPAVLAWAGRLPAGELRDQVYSRLAYERAREAPAAAVGLLAGMRPAGPTRDEAVISVVHAWATRDTAGARAWVESFPAGPLRERARAELAADPR